MGKLKCSIDALKLICSVCVPTNHKIGLSGYLWRNIGIIPVFTPLFSLPLLKLCTGNPPGCAYLIWRVESSVDAIDRSLVAREHTIQLLKHHLSRAQNRMKQNADMHRTDRSFEVDNWVYLKIQPYRQTTIATRVNQKLAAKYYGSYKIIEKVVLWRTGWNYHHTPKSILCFMSHY